MVFDENLSMRVSLPRILDHFMSSGENPDIVIRFLELHKSDIEGILKYSDCTPRLLSLDFIRRLSCEQNKRFAELLDGVEHYWREVLCLIWQIILCGNLDDTTKNIYRKIAGRKDSETMRNPFHRGMLGGEILKYDKLFLDLNNSVEYAVTMNKLGDDELHRYLKNIDMSVILPRMFQEDVFCMLDPIKQFIMINGLSGYNDIEISVFKGIKQILCGGMDVEVRLGICEVLYNRAASSPALDKFLGDQVEDLMVVVKYDHLDTSKKFNQIAMKLELSGKDIYCDWILFYLLYYRGLKFFKGCSNGHRRLFERYFDILELMDSSSKSDS